MKIVFHKKFIKQYNKNPKKIRKQFDSRLEIFELNQFDSVLNNHFVHHPYEGCRSINVSGDIRALYETVGDTVIFVRIGTHSELYN